MNGCWQRDEMNVLVQNRQRRGTKFSEPRTALVHYWYFRRRGGERVFDVLAGMFPDADVYMILCDQGVLSPSVRRHSVKASFLNRLPGVKRYYRALLPLFPFALEQFDLSAYDLVISHEAGPAKGVLTRADARHICYCHTPMRYLWDMYHEYLRTAPFGLPGRVTYGLSCHFLRKWDFLAASRVDQFIASSENGARRIRKYYGRDSEVIYPPVETSRFAIADRPSRDFYLVVSPLVQYKRIDLAVCACNALKRRLLVIGEGERMDALRRLAGPTVSFLGFQPDPVVESHYRNCRALLFPGEEDIGLTPIEAQASGRPVIAYGRGGALETVVGEGPGRTGVFFEEPSFESLAEAILSFEAQETRFRPGLLRAHAQQFDESRFRERFAAAAGPGRLEARMALPRAAVPAD
jgi:glycosyltransferase involved in cell wall biosynthesis